MFNVSRVNCLKLSSTKFALRGHRTQTRLFSLAVQHARPLARHDTFRVVPLASRNYWWSSSKSQPAENSHTNVTSEASTKGVADTPMVDPESRVQENTPAQEGVMTTSADITPPPEISDLPAEIDIPPLQYGDLSELGLISWTPAGFVRWTLELAQVSTGMPWFHTIVVTTLLYRVLLVPLSIKSLRNSARLLKMTPRLVAIKAEMNAARESRDTLAMQRVVLKQRQIYSDAGVSMGPMILNPFIQLPVTLGLFFGIKKMCTLPVEQLKQSGLAILPDLTVPDPFFILPILATAMINLQIVIGSKEMNLVERPEAGHMMNVLRGLSIFGVYFMGTLPSGLMVTLVTGVAAITLQSVALQIKPIRRMLDIPVVPPKVQGRLPTFLETWQAGIKWFKDQQKAAANQAHSRRR